jgi:hypothetical protein
MNVPDETNREPADAAIASGRVLYPLDMVLAAAMLGGLPARNSRLDR